MEKENLKSWEERGHRTFWWHLKRIYNIDRPTKYCVIFNTYKDGPTSFSVTPFDTLDEAMEEAKLINIMYHDTPKPQRIYVENGGKYNSGTKWWHKGYNLDFSNGAYFWGYAVLDMINSKIIKVVNEIRHFGFTIDSKPSLAIIDILFRGEDEIPADYIWDNRGEYDGWLQFRWGDKKNALDYIEPENDKAKNKKQNNIEEDYSLQPHLLSEEIAEDEYLDNGGTLDKKDTMISIADMLGDDNPLMKLKKQLENDI